MTIHSASGGGGAKLSSDDGGRIVQAGSGNNTMAFGCYSDNGYGYIENFQNSNGLYFYTQQGDIMFDVIATRAVKPYSDNEPTLGTSGNRWNTIYSTNSTISTSDEREKKNIKPSSLGLDFLNKLNPVEYRWKNIEKFKKAKPEAEEEFTDEVVVTNHKRRHFGLIAQEVEKVLDDNGITTEDFAPIIYDEESDRYGMRYGEYIGILIKAVQELTTRLETVENA